MARVEDLNEEHGVLTSLFLNKMEQTQAKYTFKKAAACSRAVLLNDGAVVMVSMRSVDVSSILRTATAD